MYSLIKTNVSVSIIINLEASALYVLISSKDL